MVAAVDRKRLLWTVALFFGCSVLFRVIDAAASGSGKGLSLAIQAAAATAIVVAAVAIAGRKH